MKNKWQLFLLLGILLIASFLRLWQLGSVPQSPDWDEAALGYNAISILTTGRDEYGKLLPLVLESFGDFKPALYVYLIMPFLFLFDLSLFVVRLPSALAGIGIVLVTYKLTKKLIGNEMLALIASGLVAVTPIMVHFSHVAFESNVGLLVNMLIVLWFLYGLEKPRYLLCAAFLAGSNFYMYQSERLFTPLLCLALFIIYFPQLMRVSKQYLVSAILVGFVAVLPFIIFSVTDASVLSRAQGVSIFANATPLLERTVAKLADDSVNNDSIGLLLDNRRIEFSKIIVSNYISHFDINWLFLTGDKNPRHQAPHMGHLYLWQLPLLLIGIYTLIFGRYAKKTKYLLFSWLLLTPIPASVTTEIPHAVRTLNMFPVLLILTAVGLFEVCQVVSRQKKLNKTLLGSVAGVIVLLNLLYFMNQYYVQLNYFTAYDWQYGFREAVASVSKREHEYDKIVVAHEGAFNQSYIFFLYFLQYDPKRYQEESKKEKSYGVYKTFGKYEFRRIIWEQDKNLPNTLFVGDPIDFPKIQHPLEKITYPNGTDAIWIVGNK